jgi:hypothetical protein
MTSPRLTQSHRRLESEIESGFMVTQYFSAAGLVRSVGLVARGHGEIYRLGYYRMHEGSFYPRSQNRDRGAPGRMIF